MRISFPAIHHQCSLRPSLFTILFVAMPFVVFGDDSNLVTKNPFFPKGYAASTTAPAPVTPTRNASVDSQIELRGVADIDGKLWFSIFMKSEGKGIWVQEGTTNHTHQVTVQSYDDSNQTAQIRFQNQTAQLEFREPTPNPDAPAPAKAPTPAANSQLPPGLNSKASDPPNNPRRRVIPRRRIILPKTTQ